MTASASLPFLTGRSRALRLLTATLVLGITACGGTAVPQHRTAIITVRDNAFSPQVVSIAPGDSVEWRWAHTGNPHNVTGGTFASPTQNSGSFTETFPRSGAYPVECTIHPHMLGEVDVR